ncbi:MAG: hypothetical protein ACR2PX_22690 [Endozoicomonas sp.]
MISQTDTAECIEGESFLCVDELLNQPEMPSLVQSCGVELQAIKVLVAGAALFTFYTVWYVIGGMEWSGQLVSAVLPLMAMDKLAAGVFITGMFCWLTGIYQWREGPTKSIRFVVSMAGYSVHLLYDTIRKKLIIERWDDPPPSI